MLRSDMNLKGWIICENCVSPTKCHGINIWIMFPISSLLFKKKVNYLHSQ